MIIDGTGITIAIFQGTAADVAVAADITERCRIGRSPRFRFRQTRRRGLQRRFALARESYYDT